MNCKNCGAVVNGDKCDYCGTHYGDTSRKERTYIRVLKTIGGDTLIFPKGDTVFIPNKDWKPVW